MRHHHCAIRKEDKEQSEVLELEECKHQACATCWKEWFQSNTPLYKCYFPWCEGKPCGKSLKMLGLARCDKRLFISCKSCRDVIARPLRFSAFSRVAMDETISFFCYAVMVIVAFALSHRLYATLYVFSPFAVLALLYIRYHFYSVTSVPLSMRRVWCVNAHVTLVNPLNDEATQNGNTQRCPWCGISIERDLTVPFVQDVVECQACYHVFDFVTCKKIST